MFGPGKKPQAQGSPDTLAMRETLFGDMPWEAWAREPAGEPWTSFCDARRMKEEGNARGAVEALRRVVATSGLESRCYLQAWHFLRGLGEKPEEVISRKVLGVVIEVGMGEGTDLLAAYEDGSARYWNFSGAGVVWDVKEDLEVGGAVRDVLRSGQVIADRIGFWEAPRRGVPGRDVARLNMLAPGGLLFGEGPMAVLSRDAMAMPLLNAGVRLMQLLMARSRAGGKKAGA